MPEMAAAMTRRLEKVAGEITRMPKDTVEATAKVAVDRIKAQGPQFRAMKGRRLGARYRMVLLGGEPQAIVTPVPAGLWAISEAGAKPHIITGKKGKGSRRNRQRRIADGDTSGLTPIGIPGIGVRAYAHHPGRKGKPHWSSIIDRARPELTRLAQNRFSDAVKRGCS